MINSKIALNLFTVLICFILTFSCKNHNKTFKNQNNAIDFQPILDSIYNSNKDCVGLMVHVESPEKKISWTGAIGVADTVTKIALQKDNPILIASNTKTYIAAAILRLVEDNKITLNDAVATLISQKSREVLEKEGYNLEEIKLKHLLSHTSGIFDYAGSGEFFDFIENKPNYRWTRDEQIKLATSAGEPLGEVGMVFSYSDTNYLLLSEIIETITQKHFFIALRELLSFEKLNLNTTWFSSLEDYPNHTKPLAHQYSSSERINSYSLDHSFDLYGGGGLAATTKDLAMFLHYLFSNKIFDNPETIKLMYGEMVPEKAQENNYFFGLSYTEFDGTGGLGHNGYWGSAVNYVPNLKTTIAVAVLERDQQSLLLDLNRSILEKLK
ncbi:serine hydrolase domain-containing protein [Litoribaculum gwangyangense]|uniref:Serine hydrolase domain-containing protein n=1 Tax=Litoribaculum gwangyangense TaxID=1130722 RepID=A0ABP9C5B3_9FLAO